MTHPEGNISEITPLDPVGSLSPDRYGLGRKVTYYAADFPGEAPKKRLGYFMGLYQTAEIRSEDGHTSWVPIVTAVIEDFKDGSLKQVYVENVRFKRK